MLFLTYEKSMYHLLREYLEANRLLTNQVPDGVFDRGLVARAQEFGFINLENYCNFLMLQPFRKFHSEMKHLVGTYRHQAFYQYKDQLEVLSGQFIQDLVKGPEKKEDKKFGSKLFKLLTSEVEFSKTPEVIPLNVLVIEALDGPEAYSAAMRLTSILPEGVKLNLVATESDPEILRKASEGKYPLPRMSQLSDNYRSLYTEKTRDGLYKVSGEVRKSCDFKKIDPFNDINVEEFLDQFHLIFCNSPRGLYPAPISTEIIKRCIPYLKPGGYLFATFPEGKTMPKTEGLSQVTLGKTTAYKRTASKMPLSKTGQIDEKFDTVENRLLQAKAWIMENKPEKAAAMIKEILTDHISDLPANMIQADLYSAKEERAKAITQYEKAILINPLFLPSRFNIAVLSLSGDNENQASEQIKKIREKLDRSDDQLLQKLYNIQPDSFVRLVERLEKAMTEGETVCEKKTLDWVIEISAPPVMAPDIQVPDKYGAIGNAPKEETKGGDTILMEKSAKNQEQTTGSRKVVNISELPSSRDYGKHDPWAKKKAEEDDVKRKSEEFKMLHEDYRETVKGKHVPPMKSRRKKKAPSPKQSGWIDVTGGTKEKPKKSVRVSKVPKTQAVVRTRSHKTIIMSDDKEK